jgi:hypothetical protein
MPTQYRPPIAGPGHPGGRARSPATVRRRQGRRLAPTAIALLVMLAAGGFGLDRLAAGDDPREAVFVPAPEPPPVLTPEVPESTEPADPEPRPVLALSGALPTAGPGTFRFASTGGDLLGGSGTLRRFRLAVEDGIDHDPDRLARFVDETFGDRRGWAGGGDLRFQRVTEEAGHDFTIYLATSATAAGLCADGGMDVIGSGLPDGGVSCQTPGRVILNLHRWQRSVPHFVDDGVELETYRRMLLNHEVGHELGYGHEACPGSGEPAPVMQQQSLYLDGCQAYPWPYRDGSRYSGPSTS